MCGISVVLVREPTPTLGPVVTRATDAVAHRGPDGHGVALFTTISGMIRPARMDEPATLGLGHRRLAILDLTAAGRQPMSYDTPAGRLWITYNGELFNFSELRLELEGRGARFTTRTDTEVILAAYAAWGTECVARFNGMWAFALLDERRGLLFVSRDRLGIKPLYVWSDDETLAFVSEIKQLAHLPAVRLRPDDGAVADYLLTGYERGERSFFDGVRPVAPGTWAQVDVRALRVGSWSPYWRPERVAVQASITPEGAAAALEAQLARATRWQLRSDVPVGCALSGGLDSSAIAAFARESAGRSLQTFTAVFPGDAQDEGPYAARVAAHLGLSVRLTSPTPEQFLGEVDRFTFMQDEPVGSLSIYAGYCVARLMREAGVPVTLNGQGGDEVLGGYWQSYSAYLLELLRHGHVRSLADHLLGAPFGGNTELWKQLLRMLRRFRRRRHPALVLRAERAGAAEDPGRRLGAMLRLEEQRRRLYELRELHLPRLLRWDDRNLMSFGVEGRYPFLDHELIETCLSLPPRLLFSRGWTKSPLRDVLAGRLPPDIVRRRTKWGFVTPQARWARGPLRAAVRQLVEDSSSPVWDYVDRGSARRLAESATAATTRSDEPAQDLVRLFLLDRWLRPAATVQALTPAGSGP